MNIEVDSPAYLKYNWLETLKLLRFIFGKHKHYLYLKIYVNFQFGTNITQQFGGSTSDSFLDEYNIDFLEMVQYSMLISVWPSFY